MNEKPSDRVVTRRDFLKLLAVGGVVAAGGYVLFEDAPWLNYDQQADHTWKSLEKGSAMSAQMRELVRYATLAANGHNTQPWKFAIKENVIEIHPDYTRRLLAVDPSDRELWISLGCALENLLVAARAAGYAADVTYPDLADFIHIRLTADSAHASPLFDAIPLRQNTRSDYDGQLVPTADLDHLEALPLEPGVTLRFIVNPADMNIVSEYISQGDLHQYADPAFVEELTFWLRFNKKEALASLDGLYTRSSGNPEVPRWLGQLFLAGTKPQQQADADIKKLRSAPGAVVVASESDDKAAWVRTGQVYERLALTLTSLNIKSAFLNQPIEVPDVRGQFQRAIGLGNALPTVACPLRLCEPNAALAPPPDRAGAAMTTATPALHRSAHSSAFVKLTVGFALIYLVLDRSATWTNSLFGEYGALICALVIAAALLVERRLFGTAPRQALAALGFGRPSRRGVLAALLASLVLLAYLPIFMLVTGQPLTLRDGWLWIALGVLLQGGIAEELLWRGYLFRRLRATRSFWRAAAIGMLFMVAQHTLLLWSLPLPIALAALVVALGTSFPLAYLFELGGNTVWGAALLHAIIQGTFKVIVVPEASMLPTLVGWMAACVVIPYMAFLVRRRAATAASERMPAPLVGVK